MHHDEFVNPDPLRDVPLPDLLDRLRAERAARLDVVADTDAIAVDTGSGAVSFHHRTDTYDVTMTRRGYTSLLGDRLGIPIAYADRMHSHPNPQLFARTVNWWTGRSGDEAPRPALFRMFRTSPTTAVLRSVQSDSYRPIEHLDVMTAVVSGLRRAGIDPADTGVRCDLAPHRMRVRVEVPAIAVEARDVLADYRSPFGGARGADLPLLFAGLDINNSETGGGAFTIAPRAVVQVCSNGMTQSVDVARAVHAGGRLPEGVIEWSAATQQAQLELISSKTADAVARFLSTDYLNRVLDRMREAKGTPVTATQARDIATGMFTDTVADAILDAFVASQDLTLLGFGQAATAVAQTIDDVDQAAGVEAAFWSIIGDAPAEGREVAVGAA